MPTIPEALALAARHHQAGRLQAAEQIYRHILAAEPNQADALHMLGVIAYQLRKHAVAVRYIRRAIALNGTEATFHNNLGMALKDQGKLDEAVACHRRALELNPDSAEAHNNLGAALQGQGKTEEAVACYRRALELNPDYAKAHNNLGAALQDQGKPDEAAACCRRALQLKPDYAGAHNNLGNALKDQGRLDEAAACYRRALQLKPDSAEAHNNLGAALQGQGNLDEAIACYRRALELKPDYAKAHNNLGAALQGREKPDEAVACCRRALELKPDYAEAHNNLAAALQGQGKLDEAVACCRRALELKPDYAEAHNSLGSALLQQGRLEEAVACYRQVLHLELGGIPGGQARLHESAACDQPVVRTPPRPAEACNTLGKAFGQLATILRGRLPEEDLLAMRQLLPEAHLRDDGRAALQFGLAQVLDARGDYSEAAEHLGEVNAARRAGLQRRKRDYDPGEYRSFISGMISTFTPEFFARASGFGLETELPVFIFGLPRSGTTLVEQMLASHSLVFGAGELRYCDETFRLLPKAVHRNDPPFDCLAGLDRETARRLARQHVGRLRALDERALRIVDKMPDNYAYLGLISALFPRARLIHCRRELRDVALSCWMTNFHAVPWAYDPDHIVARFEQYSRVMEHWRNALPSPCLAVDYEETVEDTEAVARRIVEWCGLEWEPRCLRFYETRRPVRTASAAQVRHPIYKSSVGRWKNYETPLGELFSKVHRLDETRLERQPTRQRRN
ncbi:MAG: tetratricopeptide repeat protein [Thermoguttaceae bacterium]|jgi:tetratricopeptide (TPR) repeat protein